MNEAFVDVDGFHIRYLEEGQGPPLVYVHGGGGLHPSQAHALLAERHRVLAFEVPAVNERSSSYADLASTMINAACTVTGGQPFNLWGTSFGGAVALWMAIRSPESVTALVLEGPAAVLPQGSPPPADTPEAITPLPREEVESTLGTLNVPTLVVFGTQDGVISPEMGRVYREKMPNCHYVLLYDAGHEAAAERPEAFFNLVNDFLTRREAFVVQQRSSLLNP